MPDNPGKIDWKKRLAAMKQAQAGEPSQSAVTSTEPPVKELGASKEIPSGQPQPEPALKSYPEPDETKAARNLEVSQEFPAFLPALYEEQLTKLETQIRRLKILAVVAACLAIASLLGLAIMMNRGPTKKSGISGENLTIKDTKGICRAWIGERDGQVQMELRDQAGRRRLCLGLAAAGEPRLTFYNKDQNLLGELIPLPDGQPGIKLINSMGEPVAVMPAPSPPVPNPPLPVTPEPRALSPLPTPSPQPAMLPLEAPKVEQQSATKPESAEETAKSDIFVANPGGKSYHLPNSPWVKNTPTNQLLRFSSAAEAEKAGFHPGRDCRPDLRH